MTVQGLNVPAGDDALRADWRAKYKAIRERVAVAPAKKIGVVLVELDDQVDDILALKTAAESLPGVTEATAVFFDAMPAAAEKPADDEIKLDIRIFPVLETPVAE